MRMPPGWDGLETISQIWKVYPELQVVICTAYSDYSLDDMIARLGRTDRFVLLKKPFDNAEVLQLANALTEKWHLLQQADAQMKEMVRTVTLRTMEMHRTQDRFQLIAEHAADLIAIVDVNGRRLYSSPSHQRVLGYTLEELQGTDAFAQIHPDDQSRVSDAARESFASGLGRPIEFRMQHRDGSWRTIESSNTIIPKAYGEGTQLLVVGRDMTERKQAEESRQHIEIQLRAAQKLESIGHLAAGIAHEINTPTQYIGDNTRFLKDAFTDLIEVAEAHRQLLPAARQRHLTDEMLDKAESQINKADLGYLAQEVPNAIRQSLDGVDRVSKIVRAMKEFSHPGTGEKTPVDLNHAIESTLTVCHAEWKYVAELATEFDPELPLVCCLPGEINQTILNLIVNASHAIADVVGDGSRGKGAIKVSTRRVGNWAEVRVRDTGTGIPDKARGRVFDPFFTTKAVGKGTGQGLAIAYSVVVEKHGGTITFQTQTGKGTTFIIRLPLICQAVSIERQAA